jgi:hypothetical protein
MTDQTFPHPIYSEIEQEWRASYGKAGHDPPSRDDFAAVIADHEKETRIATTVGLQPWLGIFEFGIEWLVYVHIALDGVKPKPPHHLVPWALTGSAVSFGLSIRALCLTGFDTPARSLLRSYVETLFLCLAALDDRNLARAYQSAGNDDEVKTFWHTTASPKNLHNRIRQIERKSGLTEDVVAKLTGWRREEYEILSQSSHLSYLAACLTAVSRTLGEIDSYKPGIFGLASDASIRTLTYAAAVTWHFSCFAHNFLIGHSASDSLLPIDQTSKLQLQMVVARQVLGKILIEHWDEVVSDSDGIASAEVENGAQPFSDDGTL